MKISVIIPVFNCEEYLEECLNSVLSQTILDLEIICIDDGSTDNSLCILEEFCMRDNRIKIFVQENQGAGVARNLGIQKAAGEYVIFLDADDYYLDTQALENMYQLCTKHHVMVCGSILTIEKEGNRYQDNALQFIEEIAQRQVVLEYNDFQFDYGYTGFLFDRELLVKNQISFPPYRRFQDPPFLVKAMFLAQRFVMSDAQLYCYRAPIMQSRFTSAKTIDLLKGLLHNLEFAYENSLNILFDKTLQRLEYEYADIIYHNISEDNIEILEVLIKINKLVCKNKQNSNYVLRVLRRILSVVIVDGNEYENQLLEYFNEQEKFALYGAGRYAKALLQYLKEKGLQNKVTCIVVSSLDNNLSYLDGIPILEISDFKNSDEDVILAVGVIYHEDIIRTLEQKKIKNYKALDETFLSSLLASI